MISDKIDEAYQREGRRDAPRAYIGASIIGNGCDAYLALSLRGFPEDRPSPKLMRIFRDGTRIEKEVIADLRMAGFNVMDIDQQTGKQFHFSIYGGIFAANADGIIELDGELLVLEIKSMNDKKWKEFKDVGVKMSHPQYYAQMQAVMGLGGYEKAVLIAYNKNTSEYWDETVKYDDFFFKAQQVRVERVILGDARKVSNDIKSWLCRGCFKRTACYGGPVEEKRRTCAHYKPALDGSWSCSKGCTEGCQQWQRFEPQEKSE